MTNTLHVLTLVPKFPNPVQPYVRNSLLALSEAGVQVSILAQEKPDAASLAKAPADLLPHTRYITGGPRAFAGHLLRALPPLLRSGQARSRFKQMLRSPAMRIFPPHYRLQALIRGTLLNDCLCHDSRGTAVSLLHSHSLFTSYNYLFLARVFSLPLITSYHGPLPPGVPPLAEASRQLLFQYGDLFLVNTRITREELAAMGCPREKIRVIPQGIRLQDYTYTARDLNLRAEPRLLSVGRLSAEKGHHLVLDAMAQLSGEWPEIHYHLAGSGPEESALREQADRLGLNGRIHFHGFVDGEDLQALFAMATVFVQPSLQETQGMAIQEAQACGLPVIASDAGGIPEVLQHRHSGLLFERGSASALADRLRELLQQPSLYAQLSRAGRSDVEQRFALERVSADLIGVYRQSISQRG